MTYQQLVKTVEPLSKLAIQDLPLPIAYKLNKLIKLVEEEAPFYFARQKEIALKYGKPRESEPHLYDFTEDTIEIASKEIMELETLEVGAEYPNVTIPLTDNLKLSVQDIRALDGLVTFISIEKEEQPSETLN